MIANHPDRHLPQRVTAVGDAESVRVLLRDEYDFQVSTWVDATRGKILTAHRNLQKTLTESDNLVIDHAGHGWLYADAGEAPELADLREVGHEGGDFLFIRSKSLDSPAK